jgi:hypothetical protein
MYEHTNHGHYWMKTPDASRAVTKKKSGEYVEGARRGSLLDAEPEERPRRRSGGECPCQDALG